jgi:hypothetical protein
LNARLLRIYINSSEHSGVETFFWLMIEG